MHACIYIYIYLYIYTYIYIYIYRLLCIETHTHIHIYECVYMVVCVKQKSIFYYRIIFAIPLQCIFLARLISGFVSSV